MVGDDREGFMGMPVPPLQAPPSPHSGYQPSGRCVWFLRSRCGLLVGRGWRGCFRRARGWWWLGARVS